ncbi:MAG: M67 family metallopeptidase [Pyrinomonadaceae bacterium]
MCAHAREANPAECCGLVGGMFDENDHANARTIYRLRNIACNASVEYEAAPEDLFAAQRAMREGGESLTAIYHSHPHAVEPIPSNTYVERAFYPSAVYFIIGLGAQDCVLRAFRLYEAEKRWERVKYKIVAG